MLKINCLVSIFLTLKTLGSPFQLSLFSLPESIHSGQSRCAVRVEIPLCGWEFGMTHDGRSREGNLGRPHVAELRGILRRICPCSCRLHTPRGYTSAQKMGIKRKKEYLRLSLFVLVFSCFPLISFYLQTPLITVVPSVPNQFFRTK